MAGTARYDVVIAGGGHNGLVAAAYLARAGRRVLVLERLGHVGGLAISERAFPGVDARLSRYSYLVSLLPRQILRDLTPELELRRRRFASYTPLGDTGLLVDNEDEARTAASFASVTGGDADHRAWKRFYALTAHVARAVAPTLLEPLPDRREMRAAIGDDEAWQALFERPVGEVVNERFTHDAVRGVVLTDALIGTFADPDAPDLLANRCFLYHVIGDGRGEWNVPVGGMGAVTGALAAAARAAGAEIRTNTEVLAVDPSGEVTFADAAGEHAVTGGYVLVNMPPAALPGLFRTVEPRPEGSQLKINMVLSRLPRLKDPAVSPAEAFSGTFHINEGRDQLAAAREQAARGRIPDLPPAEVYCHSLTDPSILGPKLRAAGAHTMTLFGLHMPARLFRQDPEGAREAALRATFASIDSVLAEPIEDCLLRTPDGRPCVEVKTPVDLETEAGLPGGHIFHQDLSWPFAEDGRGGWGVETEHERILLCGAAARRGGGVSGIAGHNAAMAILRR
ncbi:phytoene desaturase family protein [Thermostaphylospora chromogena]|uniref:Pyridine nucleotide-disulfide oxidoreductase domain-containing protein 2 n=1 Tax=Thermostaphylospora chromogena TaxID=35622 RepID=A0A1H1HT17_9ACTN|nr:NAD(P)/FAD-dependent oxidoreductase [Thermostaphylospora chromogena]SDR28552.1 Phytoene dehydrogenase-related protein [Thermostaphylospora chromogena]